MHSVPYVTRFQAIANFLMALWVLFWALRLFLVAEIVLLLNIVNLITVFGTLLRHPPSLQRPVDFVFAHVPCRSVHAPTAVRH
jgi:hypothetical protein